MRVVPEPAGPSYGTATSRPRTSKTSARREIASPGESLASISRGGAPVPRTGVRPTSREGGVATGSIAFRSTVFRIQPPDEDHPRVDRRSLHQDGERLRVPVQEDGPHLLAASGMELEIDGHGIERRCLRLGHGHPDQAPAAAGRLGPPVELIARQPGHIEPRPEVPAEGVTVLRLARGDEVVGGCVAVTIASLVLAQDPEEDVITTMWRSM